MNKIHTTSSTEETQKLGEFLAQEFRGGDVIALSGNLGAGKTTLVQGIARAFGITQRIISPTFILIREYEVHKDQSAIKRFYHIDLYRLEGDHELSSLGLEDVFSDSEGIVLIEWAEKLQEKLPKRHTHITITSASETKRNITINHG